MFSLEKKERIRSNIKSFADSLPESVSKRELLVEAVDSIIEEVSFVEREKADSSDIKLLIVEMREGFKRMDERFASVEKRFEINDKRMDERFEVMDKRFEIIDKRINFLQWVMGFSMAFLAFLITLFSYLKPPISQETLEKAIISGIEKSIEKIHLKGKEK